MKLPLRAKPGVVDGLGDRPFASQAFGQILDLDVVGRSDARGLDAHVVRPLQVQLKLFQPLQAPRGQQQLVTKRGELVREGRPSEGTRLRPPCYIDI